MDRLSRLKKTIKDAVFPRFCIHCKKEGSLLCEECFMFWQCASISMDQKNHHVSFWNYADPIARELICSWKYHYDQSAWNVIQAKLKPSLVGLQHLVHTEKIEAVVPVCLHRHRLCERGFDQASMLAEFLATELGLPVSHLLKRIRATGHQVEREVRDRVEAMKKSPFVFQKSNKLPGSVLLVDDVWTTGATMNAAASALKASGIQTIWKCTLAKG